MTAIWKAYNKLVNKAVKDHAANNAITTTTTTTTTTTGTGTTNNKMDSILRNSDSTPTKAKKDLKKGATKANEKKRSKTNAISARERK
jgi:hypothetical protein